MGRPYTNNICSIFFLFMESNDLETSCLKIFCTYSFDDLAEDQNMWGCGSTPPKDVLIFFKNFLDFRMLLLYILWEDRPILMISGSNEQLQQQLEYTLLNPDCHSWWISKMQSGRKDTLEERYAIKFCFKLGKNATETYGMLQTTFRPSCMNWASVFEWHKRFKEGRESVRDDEWCGRTKEVRTPEFISQRVRVWVRVTMLRF